MSGRGGKFLKLSAWDENLKLIAIKKVFYEDGASCCDEGSNDDKNEAKNMKLEVCNTRSLIFSLQFNLTIRRQYMDE